MQIDPEVIIATWRILVEKASEREVCDITWLIKELEPIAGEREVRLALQHIERVCNSDTSEEFLSPAGIVMKYSDNFKRLLPLRVGMGYDGTVLDEGELNRKLKKIYDHYGRRFFATLEQVQEVIKPQVTELDDEFQVELADGTICHVPKNESRTSESVIEEVVKVIRRWLGMEIFRTDISINDERSYSSKSYMFDQIKALVETHKVVPA